MSNVQNVGDVLDLKSAVCRDMDINELNKAIQRSGPNYSWCWGFTAPVSMEKSRCLRFTVTGMLHRGWVYIVLNGADLFDIYYTNKKDLIKKVDEDVYIDDLIQRLDRAIERK